MSVLHYQGRVSPPHDELLGPDKFGAYYAPVADSYDPVADVTAVTVRPALKEAREAHVDRRKERVLILDRIRRLFL
ncbi:hypothetical protein [Mycolicibacterium sphagni]|uniref:Uncharacterized protein n=1 Tax=Mycolicibacterium sphagni TaxID=1786 RepID=A0A255DQK9_9MYCO|nr:hypothetical protein [Mycolicibacterium sphagni]OYN81737.1 hypothetical protein CG716_05120 [Mycolicibacterium sphagni]